MLSKKIALALLAMTFASACEKTLEYTTTGNYLPVATYPPLTLNNGDAATIALGSNSLATAGPAGLNATDLASPNFLNVTYTQQLVVSTSFRVAAFQFIPVVTYSVFQLEIGQNDKVTNTLAPGDDKFFWGPPGGTFYDGVNLWVADPMGHRVLAYKPQPSVDAGLATFAVGQSSLTGATTSGCARNKLFTPTDVKVALGKLFVMDSSNHRLLIYNSIPTGFGAQPDVVVGQPDFTTCLPMTSQTQLSSPNSFWTDGLRLVVADSGSSRVLVWNSIPTSNGAAADFVLGQANFTSSTGATGAQGMNTPKGVVSNGTQIFVADMGNNRVLVFNSFPSSNNPAADVVIGQPDFTTTTAGTAPAKLSGPEGVAVNESFLFVSDTINHRVMMYPTH